MFVMVCHVLYVIYFRGFSISAPIKMQVEPGWRISDVLVFLKANKAISSDTITYAYLRLKTEGNSIKAGEYGLSHKMSLSELTALLVDGHVMAHAITLVPGARFDDIRLLLAQNPDLVHRLPLLTDAQLAKLLGLSHYRGSFDLEGQFYPDTYQFVKGDSDVGLLQRAHQRQLDLLMPLWKKTQHDPILRSFREALIVASLIEKETKKREEQTIISGVIKNRIKSHMPLQIDASVLYGLKTPHGPLKHKHLRIDTPYNTYLHQGLPPSPIALVSQQAFMAALQPKEHAYRYYVACRHDYHLFAKDYATHLANIKRSQWQKCESD